MHIKLAKLSGEFVWHHHDVEDEMFLVVKGTLEMRFRPPQPSVTLEPGEFLIVPALVEHCPVTVTDEVECILLEPAGTVNTGNVDLDEATEFGVKTQDPLQQLSPDVSSPNKPREGP
eukprot:SAG22_NODE_2602_length_2396_cov_1.629081_2_plen_117_part_00